MVFHRWLFYGLLVLLPTQLGFHVWPNWAIVFGRRIDYLSPTLYFTDIIIILLLIFWKIPRKSFVYLFPIIGFGLINIWFSISKPVAMYEWVKVIEYYFLAQYIFLTKPKMNEVVLYLSIGVLWSSCIAITQFVLQHSIGGIFWYFGERTFAIDTPGIARFSLGHLVLRPYATFPHPNVLGGFLAIMLPFIYARIKKPFYIIVFLFAIIALICSFSRSAWIVAALGLGILHWKTIGKYFVICSLLGLLFVFRPYIGDESVVVRLHLQREAFLLWLQSPIFGIGLGNFVVKYMQPVHNIYILLFVEIGIVGLGIIFVYLYNIIRIPLVLPLLVLGLFDHYLLTLQQGQLLFTIFLVQLVHVRENSI